MNAHPLRLGVGGVAQPVSRFRALAALRQQQAEGIGLVGQGAAFRLQGQAGTQQALGVIEAPLAGQQLG
ncbi:hypothetical protein D3C84_981170 [compost metagenome]